MSSLLNKYYLVLKYKQYEYWDKTEVSSSFWLSSYENSKHKIISLYGDNWPFKNVTEVTIKGNDHQITRRHFQWGVKYMCCFLHYLKNGFSVI